MKNANDLFGSKMGTQFYHKYKGSYSYTDGIEELARICGAFWLIELIVSHQTSQALKRQHFQVWQLDRIKDNEFKITCTDGNDGYVTHQDIPFSDFPYEMVTLWLVDGCLLLPCEY
jgi:hypothetical protein